MINRASLTAGHFFKQISSGVVAEQPHPIPYVEQPRLLKHDHFHFDNYPAQKE